MQSKSLVYLFVIVIAIPIIALSSNHEIFFGVASLIITVVSVKYLYRQFSAESLQGTEADEDLETELEELIDIDVKRFGTGLSVVYNLLVILFLFYSAFYLETIILKAAASFAILFQINFIIKKTRKHTPIFSPDQHKPQILLASVLNIAVIIFAIMNKLSKLN